MTTTVELFLRLSIPEKDSFCEKLVELGLISEMNPAAWNKTIKQLIKQSKGTLKKLYQSFRPLTPSQRAKFFQAVVDEAEKPL